MVIQIASVIGFHLGFESIKRWLEKEALLEVILLQLSDPFYSFINIDN